MKIYGPYTRPDGRKHICLYDGKNRQTISYPKYLMEQHLGRKLEPGETVDHIDRDFTNDDISNLRVVPLSVHASDDTPRVKKVKITCVLCGKEAYKQAANLDHNSKRGKAGPFCGKSCAGKYSRAVQLGKTKPLPVQPRVPVEDREYYMVEKDV